jgi:predicted MFS family arabinose efflux permease
MYLQRRYESLFILTIWATDFLNMILSRVLSWCIQRVANLGIVALIFLILVAFVWDRPSQEKYDDGKLRKQITNGQLVYVYYTLFVHVLGVLSHFDYVGPQKA